MRIIKDDFIISTEEAREKLSNNFIQILNSHQFETGKDESTKLRNANKMLNEINKLQNFQYEIDETGSRIEQEFENTKEILEQKIYSTYSTVFIKSDLFSQYKLIEESIPDQNSKVKLV